MTAVIEKQWQCASCATDNEPWRQFCGKCGLQPGRGTPLGGPAQGAASFRPMRVPTRRRRWPKVLASLLVLLVAAGVAGFAYLRTTDPAAARDRDLAVSLLPGPADLGIDWGIDDEYEYVASRAGLHIEGVSEIEAAACAGTATNPIVDRGTGGGSRTLLSDTGVIAVDIFVMKDELAAREAYEMTGRDTFVRCLVGGIRAGMEEAAVAEGLTATFADGGVEIPPPALGDAAHARRFTAHLSADGVQVNTVMDVVTMWEGRSLTMAMFAGFNHTPAPDVEQMVLTKIANGFGAQ